VKAAPVVVCYGFRFRFRFRFSLLRASLLLLAAGCWLLAFSF
jgi:hypothetical protein